MAAVCHSNGASCIACAKLAWDYCTKCQVLPREGVHKKTRLCATHFNERIRSEGYSPCLCPRAQSMDAAAKAERQGAGGPSCTGNGSSCYYTSKKTQGACTRCSVSMPGGSHRDTWMCPCCFHDFLVTEKDQQVCNCLPTQTLMQECRQLKEAMWAAKISANDQQPPLPTPPPPPTPPPAILGGPSSTSRSCGASTGELPGQQELQRWHGSSTAPTKVMDELQRELAELHATKADVEAKFNAVQAKINALTRCPEPDWSGRQWNSTERVYDV